MKPNALLISVDFADLLSVTLPRNAPFFDRIVVGSTFADHETAKVVASVSNAELVQTNEFYLHGATFNKGAVVERLFDVLGREGWICILDADILLPPWADLSPAQPGYLYTPRRRMLADVTRWPEYADNADDWDLLPRHEDEEHAGYFQLFHASDPVLRRRPWYGVNWLHAGGCDTDFMKRWPNRNRARPPFEVLHLGEDGKNWCGRATLAADGSLHPQAAARAAALAKIISARDPDDKILLSEKISITEAT